MLESEEDEAQATGRLVDRATGETVGLIYQWSDGLMQPYWFSGARDNVAVVGLDVVQRKSG